MYLYEIHSRIYRTSYRSCYQWHEGHKRRISQEVIRLENQTMTKLLLIAFIKKLGAALGQKGEQALLRSIVKLRFCAESNKRLLMIYSRNSNDAFTLAAHCLTLTYQMQKLLSHEGFLIIYHGTSEESQEILTAFISSAVSTLDNI